MSWVNILRDPEGAEFLSNHPDSDGTVPTAVTGAGVLIEATAPAIRAQLDAA